ncbi:DNase [Acinetobacter baumannii]|jgi:Restriction endonuclease|nr:EsvK1 [Acinetobacter baumannii ATCC 17978]AKQ27065.1 DNase [Acinetobacter baumannii]
MKLQTFKNKLQTLQAPAQAQKNPKQNNWGSGRGGRPWRRLKAKIHLRDEWTCQCCGIVTKDLELDHIMNVARGGTDDESNLQSLCVPCHKKKTQQESRQGGEVKSSKPFAVGHRPPSHAQKKFPFRKS